MNRIGLALSGGGFRASLYHLGLVRFLRDAGILSQVTHITSVSGGSIFGAHLVLNWDRYNGSPSEFEAAASELLSFVRLDVRNRITRRFPLTLPLRWPRRLLGLSNRKLTRTGLLEYHYEKYLYGDTSLFQLPAKPQLHILATNLSEGCLCSFNRNGILVIRPQPGNRFRIDRVHAGLATVPMAVTASSAYPGFFPPCELTGAIVGASGGEFGRQAYTDGGVFDNLGVRMFGCLARSLLAESPVTRGDFFNFHEVLEAITKASNSGEETPLRGLAQILAAASTRPGTLMLTNGGPAKEARPSSAEFRNGANEDFVVSCLSDVVHDYQFQHDPLFAHLEPVDPEAESLLRASRHGGRALDVGEQVWLNKHLLEAALRQATGHACLRRLNSALDEVLVSDVGKRMKVEANRRSGGLIRTALRASDILMDRVWQLEIETFQDAPGFVFAPITDVVEPADDPTALHPEIQRQAADIRTDMDRFSPLEITTLVRHGYCVGRKACRGRPDLFGDKLPDNAPWDPLHGPEGAAPPAARVTRLGASSRQPAPATVEARALQASALRRIWSTLPDYRDWTSYVYVPLLVPILVLLPCFVAKFYQRSHRLNQLVGSLSQGSRDLESMSRLLEGPITPWTGVTPEEVANLDEPEPKGFEILQDSRVLDLRNWKPAASGKADRRSFVYAYRRFKVLKLPDNSGNVPFRIRLLPTSPETQVRFPPQQAQPKLRMSRINASVPGQTECRWEASFDLHNVPPGDSVDLIVEYLSPGEFLRGDENSTTLAFGIQAETAELTRWLMLPEGKEYRNWRILRHPTGKPDKVEVVKIVTEYLADDFTILAYKLLSVKGGYTFEVEWFYK